LPTLPYPAIVCQAQPSEAFMAHTIREKAKLLNRVRRVKGQVEAVDRALEEEGDCGDVLRLIAACRGGMDALMAEVLEGHIREHLAPAPGSQDAGAMEDLIDVVRAYLK
jgi:DNA-binding FrmR family transcriptional regulator